MPDEVPSKPAGLVAAAALIARFGLAGVANTAIGGLVILGLDLGLGVAPHLANAIGYAVGLTASFFLNRGFVFRSEERLRSTGPKYLAAAAIAFVLNQLVLSLAGGVLDDGDLGRALAQMAGMATYTLAMLALCRFWVFRRA